MFLLRVVCVSVCAFLFHAFSCVRVCVLPFVRFSDVFDFRMRAACTVLVVILIKLSLVQQMSVQINSVQLVLEDSGFQQIVAWYRIYISKILVQQNSHYI